MEAPKEETKQDLVNRLTYVSTDSSSIPHSAWAPALNTCFPMRNKTHPVYPNEDWELHHRISCGEWPFYQSMKEIDGENDAWLVCDLILRRSEGRLDNASWYDEKDNSSYLITSAPDPPPAATWRRESTSRYRGDSSIPLIEYLTPIHAPFFCVMVIGYAAVLKLRFLSRLETYTHENVTLDFLQNRLPPEFKIPKPIHTSTAMLRSIEFQTQIYGPSLAQVWLRLPRLQKIGIVAAVANMAGELAKFKSDKIGSVEGKGMDISGLAFGVGPIGYWAHPDIVTHDWANSPLRSGLNEIVFSHGFPSPCNIILVDDEGRSPPAIGVVGWRRGGFVPKVFVRMQCILDPDLELPQCEWMTQEPVPIEFPEEYQFELYAMMGRYPNNLPQMMDQYWAAHPARADPSVFGDRSIIHHQYTDR